MCCKCRADTSVNPLTLNICKLFNSCQLANGSYVPEGKFIELSGADIPRSSDVVFIVEAKSCNQNLKETKSIMSVVASIEEQLQAAKITNNR